ncbi:MAG: response regulator transcription factor [Egibacteraceae bacterium]
MSTTRTSTAETKTHAALPSGPTLLVGWRFALVEALGRLLSDTGITAAYADGSQFANAVARHRPAVLVLDALVGREPLLAGVEFARRHCPQVRVLLLGADDGQDEALAAGIGADGIVPGTAAPSELLDQVAGKSPGSPGKQRQNRRPYMQRLPGQLSYLTAREVEILRVLMGGASNGQVAHALGISPHTVRTHVRNILGKLDARTRLEAAAVGFRQGLQPLRGVTSVGDNGR